MPVPPEASRFSDNRWGERGNRPAPNEPAAELAEVARAAAHAPRPRAARPSNRGRTVVGVVLILIAVTAGGFGYAYRDRLTRLPILGDANLTAARNLTDATSDRPEIQPGAIPHEVASPTSTEDEIGEPAEPPVEMDPPVDLPSRNVDAGMIPDAMPAAMPVPENIASADASDELRVPDFYRTRPKGEREVLEPLPREKPAVPEVDGRPWQPANPIDNFILARLEEHDVRAKPLCDDWDFARRASLDLVGLVPTQADLDRFFGWSNGLRRKLWIDFLLDQPQYADRWTIIWGDLLREQERIRGMPNGAFKRYIHQNLIENRPYDEWVREMITAAGRADEVPATAFVLANENDATQLTVATAQVFLGVQLRCAQCHDHPFDWWTQREFEGMTLFWEGTRARDIRRNSEERIREVSTKAGAGAGEFLTGQTSEHGRGREALAALITHRDNPYFARVTVNRLWEMLTGTGLVNPSDTFSALNPPSHPELLDWLAIEFVESGYDLKHILRLIANSRTYQQTSVEKMVRSRRAGVFGGGEYGADDETLFVGMPLRPMSSEQIHDSILAATGRYASRDRFQPSIRTAYPPPPRSFLRTFGSADRETLLPRSTGGSIQRALTLLNGDFLSQAVQLHAGHPLVYWQSRSMSGPQIVDALFAQILTRRPTRSEREWVLDYVAATGQPWAWEDVQWALFNTREFQFIR